MAKMLLSLFLVLVLLQVTHSSTTVPNPAGDSSRSSATSPITDSLTASPSATLNSVTNPESNPGYLLSLFTNLCPRIDGGFCSRILLGMYSFMNENPIGCSVLLALAINQWNMPLPSTFFSGADISDQQLLAGVISIFLVTFLRALMFLVLRYLVWRRWS
ncbi:hypothetical protein M0R45_017300 [Rubus argutus]|uniref:Uncharacterized protein n=1 Tax=Rubus argutus TaxID=59490 RepID=A0AAW1XXK1_RUBAR